MHRFTKAEFADIHFVYDLANGNGGAIIQSYWETYLTRRVKSHRTWIPPGTDPGYGVVGFKNNIHIRRRCVVCGGQKSKIQYLGAR
ncbi:hypothetical protein CEXT_360221 [Caerostris extrusa]|uniref:Uncharacterized protein n=1 Tax=Caerostris extrusa TaxID=172846 RepID=A0AAV4VXL9_CAEEX|nr:hypothetical protein CEXT_360221 [Caerostris extrusa]